MKKTISVLMILTLALTLCACGNGDTAVSRQFFAMDTVMNVKVYGGRGEKTADSIEKEILRLDSLLSRTADGSEISAVNKSAGTDGAIVSDELCSILTFCKNVSASFPDCFDITIAPVMDLWGFTKDEKHVPAEDALLSALELVNADDVIINGNRVTLAESGMEIDLGAVAKGYAASRCIDLIEKAGHTSALLDLGHNISAIGVKPDGSRWNVAVKDPINTSDFLGVIAMADATASTSGGYERYFTENGRTYHHILDPKTGHPAESGLISVTVVSENAMLADALSTAVYVAGADAGLSYWRSHEGFELILCTSDKRVLVTEGLAYIFTPTGAEAGYSYETARR